MCISLIFSWIFITVHQILNVKTTKKTFKKFVFSSFFLYEAKLCVVWTPQQVKIKAVSLIFCTFRVSRKKTKHCIPQNRSKNRQFSENRNKLCEIGITTCGIKSSLWNPLTSNNTRVK